MFLNPTSLVYRNLMSIDTEEMMRAQPMDACVLIGGCDKTVPAQLMGAASADIPSIQLVTGPMLAPYRGERLGACTTGVSGSIAPAKSMTLGFMKWKVISPPQPAPVRERQHDGRIAEALAWR